MAAVTTPGTFQEFAPKPKKRSRKPSSWWAIMLCGSIAGFFAGAAVFASPLGTSRGLQRISGAIADFAR